MYNTLIDIDTLKSRLNDSRFVIVDCRFDLADPQAGRAAYLSSHIPGAVYAHLDDDLSGPPITNKGRHPMPTQEAMTALFTRLGIGEDKQVVCYDASGASICARLWWMLRYMGHDAVAVLDGGWSAWVNAKFPVCGGEEHNASTRFHGQARVDRLAEVSEITDTPLLIDSRDPARYRGEVEPIDPVAGHIPGAINYFWKQNLDAQGQFRASEDLRQTFLAITGDVSPEAAVFYCGSGVTACHNVLAMVHAGLSQPRLYGGSWSEWCADPGRPVAKGDERIPSK